MGQDLSRNIGILGDQVDWLEMRYNVDKDTH